MRHGSAWRWGCGLVAVLGLLSPRGGSVEAAAAPPRFDGLWRGEIVYLPAQTEFEVVVEIGPGVDGGLAGTVDIPMQRMQFYPLTRIATDGPRIEFTFVKVNEKPDGTYGEVEFVFRGELSADGGSLAGQFKGWIIDGSNLAPFRFERAGDAGDPRPEEERPPLTLLGPGGQELREAFNRHPEAVRLILLLSPT